MEEERGDIWQMVIAGTRALFLRVASGFSHMLETGMNFSESAKMLFRIT